MGGTTTKCKNCYKSFKTNKHPASKRAATVAGAGAGAYFGSGTGLALGPAGAIAGTVPGAIAGGVAGALLDKNFVRCPNCDKVQKA